MAATYPIHPGDRLQRALATVLDDSLFSIAAFTGFTAHNDREWDEVDKPFLSIQIAESQQPHPRLNVWHVRVTVVMVEDRQDANQLLAGDTRPRHELRAENVSARLFGTWAGEDIAASINAEDNGVTVLKVYGFNVANSTQTEDDLLTEYSLTFVCTASEQ